MACVGLIPPGSFSSPCNDLWTLDLSRPPSDAAFFAQHTTGAGGGTGFAGANLYSVGASGLVSFGPVPGAFDINDDFRIGTDDLYLWEQGQGARDVNGDGQVTPTDRNLLIAALRSSQRAAMLGGRP